MPVWILTIYNKDPVTEVEMLPESRGVMCTARISKSLDLDMDVAGRLKDQTHQEDEPTPRSSSLIF